jgi:hypothetical protein
MICPVCTSEKIERFISIEQVPVHCNLLWSDRQSALLAPKGDIILGYCHTCGHIFNTVFDPALMEYTQAYENSLHFSPRFQSYAEGLAQDLIDRLQLRNKELVDLGAGQGDFLRLLCDMGDNRGWGFDTAYVPSEADQQDERLTFVQDFDCWSYIDHAPDMIMTRHVLEHIEQPQDFMRTIRTGIGASKNTLVFFEVPNMAYTLRELAIWDIIYEHCGYYTPHSLATLFRRTGFEVLATNETYAGQFLTIEALPGTAGAGSLSASAAGQAETSRQVAVFAQEFKEKVAYWQKALDDWASAGKRVVAWGAGSKGVTFLNVLPTRDQIQYIVDINPRKKGMVIVGSGQEIVEPQFLTQYQADVIILMNPVYRAEIEQMMLDMGLTAEIVVA